MDKVKAFGLGGVDYVTKPFQFEEVQARVETHLKLRQLQKDLERQNQQLKDNYDRLRELETLRDNLTHMIIHDLRAPLSIALGYLDLIKGRAVRKLDSDEMGYLDTVLMNMCRLNDMIGSLLDISRLETGNMPLNRQVCDLIALGKSVAASFDSLVEDRHLGFESSSETAMASCDEEVTRRVLGNLLQNALKFTPKNGHIRVTVNRKDTMVRLEVSDNGSGIAPEYHNRIFEKFGYVTKQVHQYSTGLGLTFCKLAVEAQGGQIGVESEEGKGSTFWFTLPPA
jgi:signal transduction histidine kinase